jgi:hypothetical protein
MTSSAKEEGRMGGAAPLETTYTAILAHQLKQINRAAPKVWTNEGWRLLDHYEQTGDVRHREAFGRHVAAIRVRLWKVVSQ